MGKEREGDRRRGEGRGRRVLEDGEKNRQGRVGVVVEGILFFVQDHMGGKLRINNFISSFVLSFLVLDALGNIPTGISLGNLHWMGAYDLCRSVSADYNYTDPQNDTIFEPRQFQAQYCRVDLKPNWVSTEQINGY